MDRVGLAKLAVVVLKAVKVVIRRLNVVRPHLLEPLEAPELLTILELAGTADKTKLAVQTMAVVVLEPVDTLGMAELVGHLELPMVQLSEVEEAQVAEGMPSSNPTLQTLLTN